MVHLRCFGEVGGWPPCCLMFWLQPHVTRPSVVLVVGSLFRLPVLSFSSHMFMFLVTLGVFGFPRMLVPPLVPWGGLSLAQVFDILLSVLVHTSVPPSCPLVWVSSVASASLFQLNVLCLLHSISFSQLEGGAVGVCWQVPYK